MKTYLPCIEIGPSNADASIIWLHGLGADGHDFEPIVPELGLPASLKLRFIFPHAPSMPVTINNGMVMPAWYDIRAMQIDANTDEAGIRHSAQQLEDLIEREIERGVASERIILAGFSQGGAIVLHTGLRYPKPLAGIMALSTYLPLAHLLEQECDTANQRISIFMAHGNDDPVVPLMLAEKSKLHLEAQGYRPEFRVYPMPHSVCQAEIADMASWVQQRLA